MKKLLTGILTALIVLMLTTPVYAALPTGTGIVKDPSAVSGSEFSSKSSIARKLDKMFAGNIGLYKDKKKTQLVDAALGTSNVPNNGRMQFWGPTPGGGGTSCFAYANAFYGHFYDGVYPHRTINGNHKKVKATGRITYKNFVKWGVRDDAAVYIREGNHSIIVLHYDENYITYVDGNGDGKGLIALRKVAWGHYSGTNIFNQKPSLIVQPTTAYFAAGSMGKKQPKPCTQGGSFHDWDEGKVTQAATCKEAGLKVYTCLDCQKTKEESVAKTTDHTFGEWTVTKAATCEKKGVKTAACQICGKEKTQALKKLGHDYGKSVTVQEATIFSAGITEKTCKRCEKVKQTKTSCTFRDKDLGITLKTKEKVFPKNTKVIVFAPGEYAEGTEELLGCSKFFLYSLEAQVKEESVQPKGAVALELKIPEGFGSNLALCQITDGAVQSLEMEIEEGALTAEVESFGMFALCDLDAPYVPEPTEPETVPETEPETVPETEPVTEPATVAATRRQVSRKMPDPQTQGYLVLIGVGAEMLVAIAVTLIVTLCKKKKKEETPVE